MPGLQVSAARALSLAPLVDGAKLVVVHLEEGNDPLALTIGARDVATRTANRSPAPAKASGPLRQKGVFRNTSVHDGLNGIVHLVEVAGGKLGMRGSRVEERRRGGAEATALVEVVEGDDTIFGIFLMGEDAHRYTHPEQLGGLDALGIVYRLVHYQVTVEKSLNSKVIEIQVGRGIEGIGQLADVQLEELLVQPLDLHPVLEVLLEAVCMEGLEFVDAVDRDIPHHHPSRTHAQCGVALGRGCRIRPPCSSLAS